VNCHLKKLLPDLLHVCRDDDEVAGAEPDQDVAVAEPVVGLDRSIPTLKLFSSFFKHLHRFQSKASVCNFTTLRVA
jgi:hypothetical protein